MAGWERHDNWPSLISLRCLYESGARAFIRASLAEGLSVSLPSRSQLHSGLWWMAVEMDCCRGRVPDGPGRSLGWWIMTLQPFPHRKPSDSSRLDYKGNPVDKLPLTRDRTLSRARCGWGWLWDSVRHHLLETGFIISSKLAQHVKRAPLLCQPKQVNGERVLSFRMRKKNSQQKDKLSVRTSEKRWAKKKKKKKKEEAEEETKRERRKKKSKSAFAN